MTVSPYEGSGATLTPEAMERAAGTEVIGVEVDDRPVESVVTWEDLRS